MQFTNKKILQHAYNVSSDLGKVAETISTKGLKGIEEFEITLFNPIRPMLADRVKSEEEAAEKFGNEFAVPISRCFWNGSETKENV